MDHAMNMRFDPFTGLHADRDVAPPCLPWLVSENCACAAAYRRARRMDWASAHALCTGMAALQFASIIVWNSAWVAPHHYRATGVSCGALWLTFRLAS